MVEKLRELIRLHGFERMESTLIRAALPAMRIKAIALADARIPAAASKFGGDPDLPFGCPWPYWGETPLTLVAQINLGEAGRHDARRILPPAGLLQFFHVSGLAAGLSDSDDAPHHARWWIQCVAESKNKLRRTPLPSAASAMSRCESHLLEYRPVMTLPSRSSNLRRAFPGGELAKYLALLDAVDRQSAPPAGRHQLLGHPSVARIDSSLDPHLKWQLMLQIEGIDLDGVSATLGYWTPVEDLRQRRFDRSIAVAHLSDASATADTGTAGEIRTPAADPPTAS